MDKICINEKCIISNRRGNSDARFCFSCGKELVVWDESCNGCGMRLDPSDKFCENCGRPTK